MVKNATPVTIDNFMDAFAREMALVEKDPTGYVEAAKPPPVGNPITLGELVPSAADWSKKLVDRAQAGASDWLANSLKPRAVPSKAALSANDKRVDKLQQSIKNKSWEGAMSRVDEDQRLVTMQALGSDVFSKGVAARQGKIEKVVGDLQPRVLALKKTLDNMPEKTDADREAKMIAAKRGMQAIGLARRGAK